MDSLIYIKGFRDKLNWLAKSNNYNCYSVGRKNKFKYRPYAPTSHYFKSQFTEQAQLNLNIYTNIKKLESSTSIYFNKENLNEKSLLVNFEDTLGHYLFVINKKYKNHYLKKSSENNTFFIATTCLPYLDYLQNKDLWSRSISSLTKLILKIENDNFWRP